MASFIGEGNQSTRIKPPTFRKSLTDWLTDWLTDGRPDGRMDWLIYEYEVLGWFKC